MIRYDQDWVDRLVEAGAGAEPIAGLTSSLRLLYIVTDTADGKQAFHLDFADGRMIAGTAGKLPRGETADVTITVAETVLSDLWRGVRRRDAAYMAGDVKVEGNYEQWLDFLVPAFEVTPWTEAWSNAA